MIHRIRTASIFCVSLWFSTGASAAEVHPAPEPSPVMVAPFVLLLLAIALLPFLHKHHWEKHYPKIAVGLGLIPLLYYLVALGQGSRMLASLVEYVGFMALIGSLFVIAGGIHINMTGRSTPAVNTGILALGAILSNFIGTTGASMLLIRPFLRINRSRAAPYQVVFFIFIVSNIGGALTPIGDPPLFLGYLKGVPFLWLVHRPLVLATWIVSVGLLLALFFALDWTNFRKHPAQWVEAAEDRIELEGSHNFLFLFLIIGLVLLQKQEWLLELRQWPPMAALGRTLEWSAQKVVESLITTICALLMIATACSAYRVSNKDALRENEFTFGPVKEVGFLFLGIFLTMVPALDLLEKHAADLGLTNARQFFWGSGVLSAVLDNAPTYLSFLTAAFGLHHLSLDDPTHVQAFLANVSARKYLVAVSLASVFFGAVTYIGNGPNFMVKSIAESNGFKCPSFLGYIIRYALPILLPLFVLISFLLG